MVAARRIKLTLLLALFTAVIYFLLHHYLLLPPRAISAPPGLDLSLSGRSSPCSPRQPWVDPHGHLAFCDQFHPHRQTCPPAYHCVYSQDLTFALCCQTAEVHKNEGLAQQHEGLAQQPVDRQLAANQRGVEPVYVSLFSDRSSLMGLIAAVNSIQKNSQSAVKFLLVTNQEAEAHLRKWIERTELKSINYNITVFNEDWVRDKISIHGTRRELASPLNFGRYYLARLFPHLRGRLVYVDSDTIVLGDITQLNNTRMDTGHAASFSDDCTATSSHSRLKQNNYAGYVNLQNPEVRALAIKPSQCSFNPGVFVADMQVWREQNITEKLEFWLNLNKRSQDIYSIKSGDSASQPPMMLALYGKYSTLDPSWNIQYVGVSSYSRKFLAEAKLLHWNGRFKPWGRSAKFAVLWDKYFIQDPLKILWPIRKPKNYKEE